MTIAVPLTIEPRGRYKTWTLDWTMDWIMDSILDRTAEPTN